MLVLAYKETPTAEGVLREWHVGSGWVYDVSRGLIVTNAHVVMDGTEFQAGPSAQLGTASREAMAYCGELDLAILRVDTRRPAHPRIGGRWLRPTWRPGVRGRLSAESGAGHPSPIAPPASRRVRSALSLPVTQPLMVMPARSRR